MRIVETSGPVGCKGHDMPLAERMVQRPRHIVGQAFCPHLVIDGVLAAQRGIAFEILAHLGDTVMDFVGGTRSEEHTSELQSPCNLVCRLLLEKKKNNQIAINMVYIV